MKSRWIVHQGKRIFYVDCTGFADDPAGLKEEGLAITAAIRKEPLDSVAALSDVRGVPETAQNVGVLLAIVQRTTGYVRKRAVVGLARSQATLLQAFNRFARGRDFMPFDDIDSALDWLAKDP